MLQILIYFNWRALTLSSISHVMLQAVNSVQQTVLIVREEEKKSYLLDFIRSMLPEDKVLIFVGKKVMWVTWFPALWKAASVSKHFDTDFCLTYSVVHLVSLLVEMSAPTTCPATWVCRGSECSVCTEATSSATVKKPSRTLKTVCDPLEERRWRE